MIRLAGFPGRADTAAGDDDIRAGDDKAVREHVVRWLGQAEERRQADENCDGQDEPAKQA